MSEDLIQFQIQISIRLVYKALASTVTRPMCGVSVHRDRVVGDPIDGAGG